MPRPMGTLASCLSSPGTGWPPQYAGEPVRQPVAAAAGNPLSVTPPRMARVWLVAGVFFLLFFAAAAPSPLYGVYQVQWRFSATTLTVVFAAYALLLLVALLVFGSVSDYLGRRWVILARAWRWPGPAGCSWRRTVSGCCSPPGRCRAPPSAPRAARSALR